MSETDEPSDINEQLAKLQNVEMPEDDEYVPTPEEVPLFEHFNDEARLELTIHLEDNGMEFDVSNDMAVWDFIIRGTTPWDELKPLLTYEQNREQKYPGEALSGVRAYIFNHSNSGKVAEYNLFVNEFNRDFDRIKSNHDAVALQGYRQRGSEIIDKK